MFRYFVLNCGFVELEDVENCLIIKLKVGVLEPSVLLQVSSFGLEYLLVAFLPFAVVFRA